MNKLEYRKTYVETLFHDNRVLHITVNDDWGPCITKEQMKYTYSHLKRDKAIGPDNLYAEMIEIFTKVGIDSRDIRIFQTRIVIV